VSYIVQQEGLNVRLGTRFFRGQYLTRSIPTLSDQGHTRRNGQINFDGPADSVLHLRATRLGFAVHPLSENRLLAMADRPGEQIGQITGHGLLLSS
jgi:hypothetical protein